MPSNAAGASIAPAAHQAADLRIPTHPVVSSDNIRSVIPGYPVT